jgi:hypothetical protein
VGVPGNQLSTTMIYTRVLNHQPASWTALMELCWSAIMGLCRSLGRPFTAAGEVGNV